MNKYKKLLFLGIAALLIGCGSSSSDNGDSNSGTASSYSRIVSNGSFLYEVTESILVTYDASVPTEIKEIKVDTLGLDIETIFISNNKLFIGSSISLYIYSISEDGIPVEESVTPYGEFSQEFVGCDPVVASGNFAYVTLTDFSEVEDRCFRSNPIDELRIYDITDINHPELVSNLQMHTPKGLSIDGNILFVCDGIMGVAIIDVSDRENPQLIDRLEGINAIDVVASQGLLVVMGSDRIKQYDYTDISTIIELSEISKS